jgi:uncharacterized membrane protein
MLESFARFANVNTVNISREERWLSLAAGTVLLVYSTIRIPLSAVLAALAAAYLFFRGLRGFCYIYEGLQMNTAISNRSSLENNGHHSEGNDFRPKTYQSTKSSERSLS